MVSLDISPVRADEYDKWKTCFEGFATHMSTTLPEEQYKSCWSRIHPPSGKDPEMFCIVARDEDGSIIGLTHYMLFRRSWKETREIYLEDVFVFSSARGKGYGKALILAVAEDGAKRGSDAMHWTTSIHNVQGARLYDRIAHHGHRWYSMDLPYKPRAEGQESEK